MSELTGLIFTAIDCYVMALVPECGRPRGRFAFAMRGGGGSRRANREQWSRAIDGHLTNELEAAYDVKGQWT